ncbi:hypothetical protein FRZ61_00520 [Hypericibacter adhaerens]|jgi:hypothetical protein|uniref:Uncharacterized protein n=1 Tax=Hypericibacter adhaerens TaxID=2602016 RepID=A0A5J6MRI3_9PROT|nr:hypothetical protein [Hypericibacter adhaerens]QEX20138.1 hypothetical protein FRZ61_00520 [Hypericibacter adhaerens]
MPGLKPKDIREIVGEIDDQRVTEILALEPTAAELAEAAAWLSDDDAQRHEAAALPAGRVAQICEILAADEMEEEDRRS